MTPSIVQTAAKQKEHTSRTAEYGKLPVFHHDSQANLDAARSFGPNDPRSIVLTHATHEIFDPQTGQSFMQHPENPGTIPALPIHIGAGESFPVALVNHQSGMRLGRVPKHDGSGWLPVVRWGTKTQAGPARYTAGLTTEQLYDVIDRLPPKEQQRWQIFAHRHGWARKPVNPMKLARPRPHAEVLADLGKRLGKSASAKRQGITPEVVAALPESEARRWAEVLGIPTELPEENKPTPTAPSRSAIQRPAEVSMPKPKFELVEDRPANAVQRPGEKQPPIVMPVRPKGTGTAIPAFFRPKGQNPGGAIIKPTTKVTVANQVKYQPGMQPPPVQMARPRFRDDVGKLRNLHGLLSAVHDQRQVGGPNHGEEKDALPRLATADFLDDYGDPRAFIVRNHKDRTENIVETSGSPGFQTSTPVKGFNLVHQHAPPGVHEMPHTVHVYSTDPKDRSLGIYLGHAVGPAGDEHRHLLSRLGYSNHPVLFWAPKIKRDLGGKTLTTTPVTFHAPVSPEQLHEFIKNLARFRPNVAKKWKKYADYYWFHRPHNPPQQLARKPQANHTDPRIVEDARTYHEEHGLPFDPTPQTVALDPDLSRRVAALYEKLPHAPDHPKIRASYEAMKREVLSQYQHLKNRGVKIEPWRSEGQPYANSEDMARDARENRHLWFFPTGSEMKPDHPLAEKTPEGLSYNDMFRAVHDWFGHAMHGHQFGPKGELAAWAEHARMFTPAARPALSAETHGQNSWVNFGPHSHLGVTERPYAEQKATLLPKAMYPKQLARMRQFVGDKEFQAFHKAMVQNPGDDTPRLVYADWLEEKRGHPELAAIIRKHYEQGGESRVFPTMYNRSGETRVHVSDHADGVQIDLAQRGGGKLHSYHAVFPEEEAQRIVDGLKEKGIILHAHGSVGKVRLARQDSPSAAAASQATDNHRKTYELARRILSEAGISNAQVRSVLVHQPNGVARASVVQAIQRNIPPELSRYIAAWWGLLTHEPSVTAFHADPEGEDTLHILESKLPGDQLAKQLQASQVPGFAVEDHDSGSRAYVFSPQNKITLPPQVSQYASITSTPGFGRRIGGSSGSPADSRAAYRQVIADFESASSPAASQGAAQAT